MKLAYLPSPYGDEPLYGVLSRCVAHGGAPSPMALSRRLFGSVQVPSIDLPHSLDRFAEATHHALGLDGVGCARSLTLAPFYLAHLSADRRTACTAFLLGKPRCNLRALLGVATTSVATPSTLRICDACRREQRRDHGEAHWRRAHQLPGVLVCPEHRHPLMPTSAPYRAVDRTYRDAERAAAGPAAVPRGWEVETVHALAASCVRTLDGGADLDKAWVATRALRERARTNRQGADLSAAFLDRFGGSLLNELGCGLEVSDRNNWLLRLVREPARRFHPVQHALVEVFVDQRLERGRSGRRQRDADVRDRADREREAVALKARWRSLLGRTPGRDRSAAAAASPDLWRALELACPGWASGKGRGYNPNPRNQRRVNLSARDVDWAGRIRGAVARVRAETPPRRATRAAVIATAGLPVGTKGWLPCLPLCEAALAGALERVDDFHVRKLLHAADVLGRSGERVSEGRIRAMAKLSGPIGEATRTTLSELVRDGLRRLDPKAGNDFVPGSGAY